jgi:hypothetical protein
MQCNGPQRARYTKATVISLLSRTKLLFGGGSNLTSGSFHLLSFLLGLSAGRGLEYYGGLRAQEEIECCAPSLASVERLKNHFFDE